MLSLRQIKSLVAVVDVGSVNRAAEVLCLAPSSVSAQLRELSSSLGVTLFEPSGRGLVLSAAGRQLLPQFRHLLALSDDVVAQARSLVSDPAGELRLYAPSSMCIYRLPPLIEALQTSAPLVELHLMERALITTEPGCSYRVAAERHFKASSLRLAPRQSFSNVEVIRRCLLAKMGIGLLPRCVVSEDIAEGRLLQQSVTGAPYRFYSTVIWPKEAVASPRLSAFLQAVDSHQA